MPTAEDLSQDDFILKRLKEVSFFKMFAKKEEIIKKIAGMCTRKTFKAGKKIIIEGESGDELIIILKGDIEIVKRTMQNEEYTVATLKADMGGIYAGELALIDNDKRSASVNAKTDCECLIIKRTHFIEFGDENPEIGLAITRVIAGQLSMKLRKSNTDVITLFSALVEEIAESE